MGVNSRANWHIADIKPTDAVDIETMGMEIDLTDPPEVLTERLNALVRREARLYDRGLWCELKMSGQSCHACPCRSTVEGDPRTTVCNIGMEQEAITQVLEGESGEMEHLADQARVGELVELAEALAP